MALTLFLGSLKGLSWAKSGDAARTRAATTTNDFIMTPGDWERENSMYVRLRLLQDAPPCISQTESSCGYIGAWKAPGFARSPCSGEHSGSAVPIAAADRSSRTGYGCSSAARSVVCGWSGENRA